MKIKRILSLLAAFICIFVLFASCSGNFGGDETIDGSYHVSKGYADFTFTVEGEKITCVYTDTYNGNTTNHEGSMTEVEDDDEDDSTVKYNVSWVDSGSGTLAFRVLIYNAKDKTITTSSTFETYVLEKQ